MARYSYGRNWSSSTGTYRNGRSETINSPQRYFDAVGSNRHGYNNGYENGNGEKVNHPTAYYKAVGEDRHGFNGTKR